MADSPASYNIRAENENLKDPHVSHLFVVEFDGIESGRFQEVGGLGGTNSIYEIKEGGMNFHSHKFVDRATYGDITLKRGFWSNPFLFDWFYQCASNVKTERKNGSISMLQGEDLLEIVATWEFYRAFPIKWDGPPLNATSSAHAVESVTLAVEHIYLTNV